MPKQHLIAYFFLIPLLLLLPPQVEDSDHFYDVLVVRFGMRIVDILLDSAEHGLGRAEGRHLAVQFGVLDVDV